MLERQHLGLLQFLSKHQHRHLLLPCLKPQQQQRQEAQVLPTA